jgi:glycerol-3-phosphate dehydrogenase
LFDILVIGGGINGAGIARDAAGRGLSVMLSEMGDLASGTSSASSKLIHGGLRYLESFEFRLVRESLAEREVLMGIAPQLVRPMRFVLPVQKGMRPGWMLRMGLFLYDNLARRKALPATKTLDLRACPQGSALQPSLQRGYEYSDCWVDDARLTILNAVDAKERGARIATRLECVQIERHRDSWRVRLQTPDGVNEAIEARTIVNATGPWVEKTLRRMGSLGKKGNVRLVKGSHIVVPGLFEGTHGFIFQTGDGRVVFALPYGDDETLIGTTEVAWSLDRGKPEISDEEISYLCDTVNGYFNRQISAADVRWSYAGVRPLFEDNSTTATNVTRDYVFDLDDKDGAPALSIFGGKLTTYRKLSEQAVDKLLPFLNSTAHGWTSMAPLPGGDFANAHLDALITDHCERWPWLAAEHVARMTRAYGTRLAALIGEAASLTDLGTDFGAGLHAAEVAYLQDHEFAQTADDILWRRSKLGLKLSASQVETLDAYLAAN